MKIKLLNKYVGEGCPVFVIAEIGSNHNQDLKQAKKLIDVSAEAGVDAVKFQLFRADSLYTPEDSLYEVFKSIELNPEWIDELIGYSRSKGLIFLASAFDEDSVELLNDLDIPAYKWASSETVNLRNLRLAASKGKPMIISTGMCDLADIYEALQVCYGENNNNVILMHCTSVYPTKIDKVNLRALDALERVFQVPVGFSDHTLGFTAAIAATAKGAKVIEKHITLDRKSKGPDHFFATEPHELKKFVELIREAEMCMGLPFLEMSPEERKIGRREGIYAKSSIARGEGLVEEMLMVKRPALGIKPRYLNALIGARAKRKILEGEPIKWEMLDK